MEPKDEITVVRKWLEAFSASGLGPQRLAAVHLLGRLRTIERKFDGLLDGQSTNGADDLDSQ